jgi:hypothetical protein
MRASALMAGCAVLILTTTVAPALPQLKNPERSLVLKVQECGWFAIYSCSRDWREARQYAAAEGGRVIDSSSPDFPNFRPGWYCAAFGPMSHSMASARRNGMLYQYPDAYVKSSC